MKENGFKLAKERSKRYPTQTITGANYIDDIALLADSNAQAETLLHNQGRTAGGCGLYVKANKKKYMWFNQRGDISKLKGDPLKVVDKFTYLGSTLASITNDMHLTIKGMVSYR